LAIAVVLLGCQAAPSADSGKSESIKPAKSKAASKPEGKSKGKGKVDAPGARVNVPAPPGVEGEAIQPREGDFRARANKTLEQALKQTGKPGFLTAEAMPPAGPPPLAAQRAYAAGRIAYHANQLDDAQRLLHTALNLAPHQPEILRMLGQIYNRWNNKVRGAYYLELAVRADPGDAQSIFALGRHALEQGRWDDAVATLAHGLDVTLKDPESDQALQWLVRYYLASALERDGYDGAAIEQLQTYLQNPQRFTRSSRLMQHLFLLDRQRAHLWLSLGDAQNRMDDPAAALQSYANIEADDEAVQPAAVVSRRVYSLLRLNRKPEARKAIIEYLHQAKADPAALALVGYATEHGVEGADLAEELQQIYKDAQQPAALAIVIADLLPASGRTAWLSGHLKAKPGDLNVLDRFAAHALALSNNKFADPAAAAALVKLSADAVEQAPQHATDYAIALTSQSAAIDPLTTLMDGLPSGEKQRLGVRFLRAGIYIRQNKDEPAGQELRALLEQKPDFTAARLQLAALMVAQEQFEQAAVVLEPLKDSNLPQVATMRMRVLAETGKSDEALKLANELIARQPTNVDLIVDKAMLQLKTGDAVGAERTLWDALNLRPEDERLYAILFQLYDSDRNPLPDATRQYVRLMRKMLGTIPQSRLARIKRAQTAAASGDFDVASELLRGVLNQNAKDYEALDGLLEVLVSAGKREEADKLLQQRMGQDAGDRGLMAVAYKHYHDRLDDDARANQVAEQLLLAQPRNQRRDEQLAKLYLEMDRPADAVKIAAEALAGEVDNPVALVAVQAEALIRQQKVDEAQKVFRTAIARYADHEADLMFLWGAQLDQAGQRPKAEQVFLDLLRKHPDHADANNHLGYTWADQGRNLEQARAMIEKAVAAEPNNSAYLDSLGWVHYKLGAFPEAVRRLKQAVMAPRGEHPVILDHLGDALYRAGEQREAVQVWRRAQQHMTMLKPRDLESPDLKGLGEKLAAKIQAVVAKQAPAVADVPGNAAVDAPRADAAAAEGEAPVEAPAPMQPAAPEPAPAPVAP
jgi:tetratricopeptide (TPR) repeat protein